MRRTLVKLLRTLIALAGALIALLGLYGVLYTTSDRDWGPAVVKLMETVLGVWLYLVGITGRISGRAKQVPPTA